MVLVVGVGPWGVGRPQGVHCSTCKVGGQYFLHKHYRGVVGGGSKIECQLIPLPKRQHSQVKYTKQISLETITLGSSRLPKNLFR